MKNREESVMNSRLQIKRVVGQFLLFLCALFLVAYGCGGGGGGDGATNSQGTFEDSIVEGLEYQTASRSGFTDANGIFEYQVGETVTFSIGDIILGQAPAKAWMTPIDLVSGAVDPTDPTVSNICRFLMTLDDDDNPDNGIFINESVREDAKGRSVDFSLSIADFENDPDVQQALDSLTTLTSAGQRSLCSCGEAQIHLGNLYPSVNPESITVSVGGTGTATITGGRSPYSASSNNPSVATVSVNGNTASVTGVAEGTATITITDGNKNSVTLAVIGIDASGEVQISWVEKSGLTIANTLYSPSGLLIGYMCYSYFAVTNGSGQVQITVDLESSTGAPKASQTSPFLVEEGKSYKLSAEVKCSGPSYTPGYPPFQNTFGISYSSPSTESLKKNTIMGVFYSDPMSLGQMSIDPWEFTPVERELIVWVSPQDSGSVSDNLGLLVEDETKAGHYVGEYEHGTKVTLTATPAPGFVFKEWYGTWGGLFGSSNPITFSMDIPTTYMRADFEQDS